MSEMMYIVATDDKKVYNEYCHNCTYSKNTFAEEPCSICIFRKNKPPTHFVHINDSQPKDINYETATEEIQKGIYEVLGQDIGKLVDEKNLAYGNSFNKIGDFLKLLYPDGVKPEQYSDMLALTRMFDKQMRIATRKDAFGESPYRDLVGYSLLGAKKDEKMEG